MYIYYEINDANVLFFLYFFFLEINCFFLAIFKDLIKFV